jgi:voltage-gated potassium channel
MGVLVLEFGSLAMLNIEQYAPGANITTASDAVWYVIVTISTVGYGDQFPVTNRGRFLGAVIIVIGVGIFGTFTGYLANLFLGSSKEPTPEAGPATSSTGFDLARLRELVAQQQATVDEIDLLLDTEPD